MLNNVPIQVNRASRAVTLRHPNGMDCTVWRKTVNRTEDTAPTSFGGLPTIEGLGVLDSEDEANYTYAERGGEGKGDGRIVFLGTYQAPTGNMIDTDDGLNYGEPPIEALIECSLDPQDPLYWVADKPDMVTVYPGNGFALVYEVVGVTGNINIPPYTRRYLLNPRSDANVGI